MQHYPITVHVPARTYWRLAKIVPRTVAASRSERVMIATMRAIAALVREVPTRREQPVMSAEDVRAARAMLGLSAKAFGAALGVSRETVKAWEAGRRTCHYQKVIDDLVKRA